jgi:hypothetical protein
MAGWIGVDLDGTLAEYVDWRGAENIGAPIPPMVMRVQRWLAEGKDVRIFTARVDGGHAALALGDPHGEEFKDTDWIRGIIERWCEQHIGCKLPITNVKDYGMIELWDDRAIQIIPNTGRRADGKD